VEDEMRGENEARENTIRKLEEFLNLIKITEIFANVQPQVGKFSTFIIIQYTFFPFYVNGI